MILGDNFWGYFLPRIARISTNCIDVIRADSCDPWLHFLYFKVSFYVAYRDAPNSLFETVAGDFVEEFGKPRLVFFQFGSNLFGDFTDGFLFDPSLWFVLLTCSE